MTWLDEYCRSFVKAEFWPFMAVRNLRRGHNDLRLPVGCEAAEYVIYSTLKDVAVWLEA